MEEENYYNFKKNEHAYYFILKKTVHDKMADKFTCS